ncbi:ribosomal protein S18-alanine N-acetyltransferase [Bacillus sp. DTU_2020_1000418_1_SI_GHA_SEK_038]|uniref:ribosomal protein S18-alanine N-acetyltransferase n=1 Tax=Bacillus sp. DTU_2020_1000418_1_SI_GHA_SEK_038 TaxID=3077585 RepID=UPI0028E45503|nr:ribosomal protein S18-alanine N-acetyltransferase [Bacillus sp. DTU_2020_1000418_1_SI_GHA_SEK_038]WNS75947.1 ribosomal protein S18-alanine N-acetyltransferase [Bacillus sp. DTU_2020_1000418_1_SI_GHA_SEK_038]
MTNSITFRVLNENDVPEVLKIEHASFTLPWTEEAFRNEFKQNKFAVYIGLEDEGTLIGYCGVWIIVDEAHITNVAVLPEYRGLKLGEALMRKIMEISSEMGAKTMTLEVRVSNSIAQSLYRKLGFQDGAIRKSYYTDNREDALVMWVNL